MVEKKLIAYYLSPTTSIDGPFRDSFGLFETIGGMHDMSSYPCWAVDNGRFTGAFTEDKWIQLLTYHKDKSNLNLCRFAVTPDCPMDAKGTLEWFWRYKDTVRDLGYSVALTSQNGMTSEMVPWDEIDCLFVAGDDTHKRGPEGRNLIIEAKIREKYVHVGRVNSGRVIRNYFWMADSWDGTTLARHPTQQHRSIGSAVLYARAKQAERKYEWSYYMWPSTSQPSLLPT